jgi:SAM-dependent methyltransferase
MNKTPEFDFEAVFAVEDYMYYYSDLLTDEVTDMQVSKLVAWLGLEQPHAILDVACGFGRHANRLAELGHVVTGLDLTEGFLELARQEAVQRGVSVNYIQGDMRRLDYNAAFDDILLLFTAFGYFGDEENADVLRQIGAALKPGGRLIMDTMNRDTFLKGYQPQSVREKDGNLLIDMHHFDSLSGRLSNRRIMIRDGIRKEMPFFVRLYNPSEMNDLLRRAGMEIEQIYGGWDGRWLDIDARRMVIVARKVEG